MWEKKKKKKKKKRIDWWLSSSDNSFLIRQVKIIDLLAKRDITLVSLHLLLASSYSAPRSKHQCRSLMHLFDVFRTMKSILKRSSQELILFSAYRYGYADEGLQRLICYVFCSTGWSLLIATRTYRDRKQVSLTLLLVFSLFAMFVGCVLYFSFGKYVLYVNIDKRIERARALGEREIGKERGRRNQTGKSKVVTIRNNMMPTCYTVLSPLLLYSAFQGNRRLLCLSLSNVLSSEDEMTQSIN